MFQLASLTDVDWPMSGEVVLMTLVGRLGIVFGPVGGAFFMIGLENYLTAIGQWVSRGPFLWFACYCSAAELLVNWHICSI